MEPVTKDQLVAVLTDVLVRVQAGDSFEGFINYLMPEPGDGPEICARLEARYRMGNLDGQGSMRMIGVTLNEGGD